MVLPNVSCALLHQPSIKTTPHTATSQSDRGNSSIELPSSQLALDCVNLTINLTRTDKCIHTAYIRYIYRYDHVWVFKTAPLANVSTLPFHLGLSNCKTYTSIFSSVTLRVSFNFHPSWKKRQRYVLIHHEFSSELLRGSFRNGSALGAICTFYR